MNTREERIKVNNLLSGFLGYNKEEKNKCYICESKKEVNHTIRWATGRGISLSGICEECFKDLRGKLIDDITKELEKLK